MTSEQPTGPEQADLDLSDAERADPQLRDPEHARSEEAGETPPQPDAERMESALREGGPLPVGSDERLAQAEKVRPVEDGPGTSLA